MIFARQNSRFQACSTPGHGIARTAYRPRPRSAIVAATAPNAASDSTAPTRPASCIPGPDATQPPATVPKAMPTLYYMGSNELASVSALGQRALAVCMNIEMTGTLTVHMVNASANTKASVAGTQGVAR